MDVPLCQKCWFIMLRRYFWKSYSVSSSLSGLRTPLSASTHSQTSDLYTWSQRWWAKHAQGSNEIDLHAEYSFLFLCVNTVKLFIIMPLCFCNHMRFGESITSVYRINSESSRSLHVVTLVPFSFNSGQQRSNKSNKLDRFYLEFKFFSFKILNWRVNRVYIYHFSWWSLSTQSCVPVCSLLCVFNHSHWWQWWTPQRTMGGFF